MNWYEGEVSSAIQKAIGEKKVFIVFVKDESENSTKMEALWEQVTDICTEEKCVAINISASSVSGQQFGAIYPVLVVPSTYLINNQGITSDIIPGLVEKEEFVRRLTDAIANILEPVHSSEITEAMEEDAGDEAVQSVESATFVDNAQGDPINGASGLSDGLNNSASGSSDGLNDDLEAELTPQEKTQIEMLREKVKAKKEQEEKQRLKEMERKRRETGQELKLAQRELAERQATKLAKEIADRKSEDKAAREKVRQQIKQDQMEKKARFEKEKKDRTEVSKRKIEAVEAEKAAEVEKKKAALSNTARILFRLPDGSSISNSFNSDANFFLAETFVKEHLKWSRVRLTTVYPKHEFNSEDMLKTFRDLGLAPNASIIVSAARAESSDKALTSSNPGSFIWMLLAPIFALFSMIASIFSSNSGGNVQNQQSSPSVSTPYSPDTSNDSSVRRRNVPSPALHGNIQRLRRDDDDENATWNGNSTQQM